MQKKEGEDNNKKQGFIVEKTPKYGAFYRKVGKMAKIVTAFFGGKSCIFVGNWVQKLSSQILWKKKEVGKSGKLPIANLQTSRYKSVRVSAA